MQHLKKPHRAVIIETQSGDYKITANTSNAGIIRTFSRYQSFQGTTVIKFYLKELYIIAGISSEHEQDFFIKGIRRNDEIRNPKTEQLKNLEKFFGSKCLQPSVETYSRPGMFCLNHQKQLTLLIIASEFMVTKMKAKRRQLKINFKVVNSVMLKSLNWFNFTSWGSKCDTSISTIYVTDQQKKTNRSKN